MWVDLMRLLSLFWSTGDLFSGLQILTVTALGAVFCVQGQMTAGDYIAFVSYNAMLTWPVRSIGRVIAQLSKAGVSIDRLACIMNSEVESDVADATDWDMHQDIVFDHVSFSYEAGGQKILDDVSFTIPKGTTFGILGGTGSGKSTLVSLLDRLYDLKDGEGEILVGGRDIRKIRRGCLRENIGMVLQEPYLFSRTLSENIRIARQSSSMAEVRDAARIACLDDSIERFQHGYDTYVGERGTDAGGLTVDWFVKVVQQLFNPIYGLFIPTENGLSFQPFVNSAINMDQHLKYFTFAGRFIARAIIQDTPVPAHLTHGVLKKILGHSLTLRDLEVVDPQLYNSLTYIRDNCADYIGLNFTREIESFGRHYTVKLKKDGDQIDVTDENKEEYIQLMLEHRLYGQTKAQIDAFVNGFLSIIPRESLKSFTSNELDLIICGLPDISIDDLEQNVEFMGPYTHQSQTIKDLFAILRSWDTTKRSLFLIFVTSSSNVPVGGFGQMSNRFRICYVQDVKHLPEAHTCFNQLDLPDYRSYSTLEEKLLFAIQNTESFEKA